MKWWTHAMCGKQTQFAAGVDPNKRNEVCRWCNVALGGWFES
jgi:hypothetical protein